MTKTTKQRSEAVEESANRAHSGSATDALTGVGDVDMKALTEAFQQFTRTNQLMEESYRRLEARLESLDKELQEKNQELEHTTDYLNSMLESMSDGVIALDTDGIITTFNRAAADILGLHPEDVVGRPYSETFGSEFSADEGPRAAELATRNGAPVPVSLKSSPLADGSGDTTGTVMVFQDLREIEALREQVRRKDRLAAIGEMAATVAHEIRNPLGGIRGFAALLQQDIDEDDPRARLVEKIIVGTKNLDRVVDELLEYTRPIELHLKIVNCAELIDSAIGYLDRRDVGVIINNKVNADFEIEIDPDKMRRVLLNMLLNALQSIDGDGSVAIEAEVRDKGVALSISDTGSGIPEDQIDRVFSPFYTTKEKGTGLGLAVASKTVESHGGSIKVYSEIGEGSKFEIFLPNGD